VGNAASRLSGAGCSEVRSARAPLVPVRRRCCASMAPPAFQPPRKTCVNQADRLARDPYWRSRLAAAAIARFFSDAPQLISLSAPFNCSDSSSTPSAKRWSSTRAERACGGGRSQPGQSSNRPSKRPEDCDGHHDDADQHAKDPFREEQGCRLCGCPATPPLARKVGNKRIELAERAGAQGPPAPLVELLGGQPARDRVVAQPVGDALAIRVGSPNRPIAHSQDLTASAVSS
jgi:hypothetical protein